MEKSAVQHVAIDLGSKESQVCIRTADGAIVEEKKHPTRSLGDWMKQWPTSRVILETSSEAFRVADAARAAGHEVRVVRSTLAKQLGIGDRGIKTDIRDARTLSLLSCRTDVESVHIPTEQTRQLRSTVTSRELLVQTRTQLINHAKAWLRTQLWRLRSGSPETLPDRLRAKATEQNQVLPPHIERVVLSLEAINLQVTAATTEMKKLAKESSTCRLLMTIPGIGPITAVTFVAAIGEISRFEHGHRLESYVGLTPGECSSSERERRTSITKAGPSSVRRTLIQAAWAVWRGYPNDPMARWAMNIAERRGRPIAIVALARKLAGIMYAVWRTETPYQASKAGRPTELAV
jgi:transposase